MGTSPRTGLVTQPTQTEIFNQLQRSGYSSTSSSLICADKLAAAQHMCSRVHSVSFLRRSSSPLLRVQRLLSTCSRGFPFRVPSSSPCPLVSYGLSTVRRAVRRGTVVRQTVDCTSQLPRLRVVHFRKESSPMSCCQAAQYVPGGFSLALFTMKLRVVAPLE